jgi:hypothetical protein
MKYTEILEGFMQLKSSHFWDTTPCSPLKMYWRSKMTCRFLLQNFTLLAALFHASYLLGFFFDPNAKGDVILQDVCWLPSDYAALYPIIQNSSNPPLRSNHTFYAVTLRKYRYVRHNQCSLNERMMEYSCQKTTQFLMRRLCLRQTTRHAERCFLWIPTQLSWARHMHGGVQATCMLTCVRSVVIACALESESEASSSTPASGRQSTKGTSKSAQNLSAESDLGI